MSLVSEPVQATLSSQICPVPWPKPALDTADAPEYLQRLYCSQKIWWGFNLVVWRSAFKPPKLPFIAYGDPVPKSHQCVSMRIWGSTAKFNSCQYSGYTKSIACSNSTNGTLTRMIRIVFRGLLRQTNHSYLEVP